MFHLAITFQLKACELRKQRPTPAPAAKTSLVPWDYLFVGQTSAGRLPRETLILQLTITIESR